MTGFRAREGHSPRGRREGATHRAPAPAEGPSRGTGARVRRPGPATEAPQPRDGNTSEQRQQPELGHSHRRMPDPAAGCTRRVSFMSPRGRSPTRSGSRRSRSAPLSLPPGARARASHVNTHRRAQGRTDPARRGPALGIEQCPDRCQVISGTDPVAIVVGRSTSDSSVMRRRRIPLYAIVVPLLAASA